jgi:hypothetical protein
LVSSFEFWDDTKSGFLEYVDTILLDASTVAQTPLAKPMPYKVALGYTRHFVALHNIKIHSTRAFLCVASDIFLALCLTDLVQRCRGQFGRHWPLLMRRLSMTAYRR